MAELKWPDRFFRIHKEAMREGVNKYDDGMIFAFRCRESWDEMWQSEYVYMVRVKIKRSDKSYHMIPLTIEDVKTAEAWERKNAKVGDDEFAN